MYPPAKAQITSGAQAWHRMHVRVSAMLGFSRAFNRRWRVQKDWGILRPEDVGGVCLLLFTVSGFLAMERGSELMEPRDLIEAIYIADLEHVSSLWNDWEGFERFITSQRSTSRLSQTYVNRILYLVRVESASREHPGSFVGLGKPSPPFRDIVISARRLASERCGNPTSPSSRDLLFSACSHDPELAAALQASGLQPEKLLAAVRRSD